MKKLLQNTFFKGTTCALIIGMTLAFYTVTSFAATVLKVGSEGSEVSKLQQTIKNKGYYTYRVTGYYGSITKDSVIRFQKASELTADGIAGPATLSKLYTVSTVLKYGSSGSEVSKLQQALKDKGYFNDSVTGYFGSVTKNAIISFQRKNNLTPDGIAGPITLNKLYSSTSVNAGQAQLSEDIYWLSRIIEAEAVGESYTGKVAVGSVVMNRVNSSLFPNTVKGVIFEYFQGIPMFSPVDNGSIYNTPSQESINAAYAAYNGEKPVGNATYFFNPDISKGTWIVNNKSYVTKIGDHAFYA